MTYMKNYMLRNVSATTNKNKKKNLKMKKKKENSFK